MEQASTPVLHVEGVDVDFSDTHPTCANVLENELLRLDQHLLGEVRPSTERFLAATRSFLDRFGSKDG